MHRLEDGAYSEDVTLHPEVYTMILYGPSPLFPNLRELRVDLAHLREPFIAPSVVDLTLLITGKLLETPDCIGRRLRCLAKSLPNVQSLRIDGDCRGYPFIGHVACFCHGLAQLQRLTLSWSMAGSVILRAVSCLTQLRSIRIAEYSPRGDRRPKGSEFFTGSVPVVLQDGSFVQLSEIGVIARTTVLASRFILSAGFPSASLVTLWIRCPTTSHLLIRAVHVRQLLTELVGACFRLEALTLRLADMTGPMLGSAESCLEQLSYDDIEGFLSFPSLTSFAVDHNLPLLIHSADVQCMAVRAGRMKSLWLNPYPRDRDFVSTSPSVESLVELALHCPELESLALQMNACGVGVILDQPHPQFQRLDTLFVGWSHVNVFPRGQRRVQEWETLAEFLVQVLSRGTELRTVLDYRSLDHRDVVSFPMETMGMMGIRCDRAVVRNANAWRSVFAMVKFLQGLRRCINV